MKCDNNVYPILILGETTLCLLCLIRNKNLNTDWDIFLNKKGLLI
jgi:hypothetical protein